MDKVLGMIGLARRAGVLYAGIDIALDAIKSRRAKLVIIAADASQGTKKTVTDSCRFYKTEYAEYSDKEALGRCIGRESCAVAAICDAGMAGAVMDKISGTVQGKDR